MKLKTTFISALFPALLTVSPAEVVLLTGDTDNNLHNSSASLADISADGDRILFATSPPVTGSTPGITQSGLYVRRISTNTLTFVGDAVDGGTAESSFSDNGRYVTWRGVDNFIYWRDSQSNETRLVTPAADGASRRPLMSADGRFVAYCSVARNIVSNSTKLQPAGHPGIYLYDSVNETTVVVSLTDTGDALDTGVGGAASVASAFNEFDFSANGKFIVFSSDATNVHSDRPANYPAGFLCIYRRHLTTGAVDLISRNMDDVSDGNFFSPRISANGNRALFAGSFVGTFGGVRMVDSVTNSFGTDYYVKDIGTGDVWWASRTTDNSVSDGVYSSFPALSGDGETVAFGSTGTKFVSDATDPLPGNTGTFDVFRVDLGKDGDTTTSLITTSPNGSGNVDFRVGPLIPGTGDYVAFCTSQVEAMLGTGSNDTINFQGFSVGDPAPPPGPEIVIEQPADSELVDGTSKKSFGTVPVGVKGSAKTFVIRNIGSAKLTGLSVTKSGSGKGDFLVTGPSKTSRSSGTKTTFKVYFKPTEPGTRKAVLRVTSNDADEDPFDIVVSGMGG